MDQSQFFAIDFFHELGDTGKRTVAQPNLARDFITKVTTDNGELLRYPG